MTFKLTPLPYAENALEPVISAKTLQYHHGKHHAGYVNKLNELTAGTELAAAPLTEVIFSTQTSNATLFNNAAQVWNHEFFWASMKPQGGGAPTGQLGDQLGVDFGDRGKFIEQFVKVSIGHFGSGWSWLVKNGGKLEIAATHDADLPILRHQQPLFCCDLWEHAYYLDYQNRREDFVRAFLDKLVNWDFAARQFEQETIHADG